jgi:hypothetical protein
LVDYFPTFFCRFAPYANVKPVFWVVCDAFVCGACPPGYFIRFVCLSLIAALIVHLTQMAQRMMTDEQNGCYFFAVLLDWRG